MIKVGPEVEARLDWIALTEALAAGHRRPRADTRDAMVHRGDDTVLTRTALIDGLGAAVKVATIFPGNARRGRSTVNGSVMLLSDTDGTVEAMLDFDLVTRWKTAADSLLAARLLAPPAVRRILIVGAGTIARTLRAAYGAGFPEAHYVVWNRSAAGAERLAERHPGTAIAADLAEAVAAADIVSVATLAESPLIRGEWLRPDQHLDLIGAFRPGMREADDTALRRARIFVDSRESAAHVGEIADPTERGVIAEADILGDFYDLDGFGRGDGDITLFKNCGGAHLDLMTARYILAARRG